MRYDVSMTFPPPPPGHGPVFDYPEPINPRPAPRSRKHLYIVVGAMVAVVALVASVLGWVVLSKEPSPANNASDTPQPYPVCAPTNEGRDTRSEMFYTDKRYLSPEVSLSEDVPPQWCVFTTSYPSGMYWGAVYVGEDNPLYKTMTANGTALNETRATVIYQDIVPLKFAANGWVGFTADGYSEFATKALAIQVRHLADRLNG